METDTGDNSVTTMVFIVVGIIGHILNWMAGFSFELTDLKILSEIGANAMTVISFLVVAVINFPKFIKVIKGKKDGKSEE